jgi:hypothetical protein
MSESVDPLAGERCADCPGALAPEPVPVLGPYIGVVGAVLCILVGAFLLLAPYAFDYRDGAATAPRAAVVDLATGGAVAALGVLTAALFGTALVRRLRPAAPEPGYGTEPYPLPGLRAAGEETGEAAAFGEAVPDAEARYGTGNGTGPAAGTAAAERIPEPRPSAASSATAPADPAGALRDLLTPLVAALAADLRARESGGDTEGKHL